MHLSNIACHSFSPLSLPDMVVSSCNAVCAVALVIQSHFKVLHAPRVPIKMVWCTFMRFFALLYWRWFLYSYNAYLLVYPTQISLLWIGLVGFSYICKCLFSGLFQAIPFICWHEQYTRSFIQMAPEMQLSTVAVGVFYNQIPDDLISGMRPHINKALCWFYPPICRWTFLPFFRFRIS